MFSVTAVNINHVVCSHKTVFTDQKHVYVILLYNQRGDFFPLCFMLQAVLMTLLSITC